MAESLVMCDNLVKIYKVESLEVVALQGLDLEVAQGYTQRIAYGNAKLEMILFAKELNARYHDAGLSAAAFHPGNVASNFASDTDSLLRFVYHTPLRRLLLISPAKGARTLVWLAAGTPGTDWRSGEYFVKCKVSDAVDPHAVDPENARRLWEESTTMVDAWIKG